MCLNTTKNCFRYAKNDIECYKVLVEGSYHYETPFAREIVRSLHLNGKEPFAAKGRAYTRLFNNSRSIDIGYIHTFTNLENAIKDCYCWYGIYLPNDIHIFKCVIPKGTRYAIGQFKEWKDAYASKQIIFKEEVEYERVPNQP